MSSVNQAQTHPMNFSASVAKPSNFSHIVHLTSATQDEFGLECSINSQPEHRYVNLNTFWYNFLALITTLGLVISLVSNLIIIYLFTSTPKLRTNSSNIIAVNLSLSDLLYCTQWPSVIYCCITQSTWMLEIDLLCQTFGFITVSTALASILTVLAMSIERAIVIIYPIHAKVRFTNRAAWMIVVLIWVIAVCSCLPPLFGKFNRYTLDPSKTSCTIDYLSNETNHKLYVLTLYVAYWILPAVFITICYSLIIATFKRSTNSLRTTEDSSIHQAPSTCPYRWRHLENNSKERDFLFPSRTSVGTLAANSSNKDSMHQREEGSNSARPSPRSGKAFNSADFDTLDRRQQRGRRVRDSIRSKNFLGTLAPVSLMHKKKLSSQQSSGLDLKLSRADKHEPLTRRSASGGDASHSEPNDSSRMQMFADNSNKQSRAVNDDGKRKMTKLDISKLESKYIKTAESQYQSQFGHNQDDTDGTQSNLTSSTHILSVEHNITGHVQSLPHGMREQLQTKQCQQSYLIDKNSTIEHDRESDSQLNKSHEHPTELDHVAMTRRKAFNYSRKRRMLTNAARSKTLNDIIVNQQAAVTHAVTRGSCELLSCTRCSVPTCGTIHERRQSMTQSMTESLTKLFSRLSTKHNDTRQPAHGNITPLSIASFLTGKNNSNSSKSRHHMPSLASLKQARSITQFRLAKMSFYLILLWFISWTPIATLAMLHSVLKCHRASALAVFAGCTMTKLGPAFDVFIYGISHPNIKSKFKQLMMWLLMIRRFGQRVSDRADSYSGTELQRSINLQYRIYDRSAKSKLARSGSAFNTKSANQS